MMGLPQNWANNRAPVGGTVQTSPAQSGLAQLVPKQTVSTQSAGTSGQTPPITPPTTGGLGVGRIAGGRPPVPTPQGSSADRVNGAQADLNALMQANHITDPAVFAALYPGIYAQLNNNINSAQNAYEGTPYANSQSANWARPNGDPNAPWASGQASPMAGVDQRVANQIFNPNAYQYGGQAGLAASEAARYGGLSDAARQQQAQGNQQYQNALGQYGASMAQSDQARAQQMQGLGYLQNMAEGNGPSAAQAQMAQGLAQAREQQASIAANARGGGANLAAAQAAGANAAGNLSLQGIQATGALRAQEQANAMSQYGQQAAGLRSSDFGAAQLAGQQQQMAAGQQQFGATQASQYEQYMQQIRSQQQGYQQSMEQQNLSREAAMNGWSLSQQQVDNAQTNSWIGAAAGIGSAALMAAASDENAKKNVSDAGADLDDTMSKLKPVNFEYKEGLGLDAGSQTGIMAQDLQKSKAGAGLVFKGPDGILRVKGPQAATLALAGLSRLNDRLRKLEARNAGK
jgi:hypothetical protein